jgi:large subunit ribosomal protein L30
MESHKMSQIKVKQVRSLIGVPKKVKAVVNGLGLGKIGQERVYKDNTCIRGQVNKIKHLVSYELITK